MILREVLDAHIPTLTLQSTVRDAIDKMDIYQFSALVIVDDQMKPIGVLTEGDLCRAVSKHENLISIGGQTAFNFATKYPTTVTADTEISDALHKMLMSGLTLLPVVDEERLVGVVLRVDLMQALLMDLPVQT